MDVVSKEQWEIDVENTIKERDAFEQISKGFKVLSKLPENQTSGKSAEYDLLSLRFANYFSRCHDTLEKIVSYGVEHGYKGPGLGGNTNERTRIL